MHLIDTFKIQKRGIESKRKKFKDYDLRSKEREKVQQISSYNKQKLENKEQLKLKTCITGKEKDGQNFSRNFKPKKIVTDTKTNKEGKWYHQPAKFSKERF